MLGGSSIVQNTPTGSTKSLATRQTPFWEFFFWNRVIVSGSTKPYFLSILTENLRNKSGTCWNASVAVFASKLHVDLVRTILQSFESKHLAIFHIWKKTCLETHTKRKYYHNSWFNNPPNSSILWNFWAEGVSPNRFLSDPGPDRSSGHINTTK